MIKQWIAILWVWTAGIGMAETTPLFDFESGTYDGWTLEGEAFAPKPFNARAWIDAEGYGRLHRKYSGFQGNYIAKTGQTRHEKNPDGKLISSPFEISKNYLTFLLAGEVHPLVKVYLEVDGKEVRTAYGNNSYDLRARGWDVRDLKGKQARIVIQDTAPCHSLIRADFFQLSDEPPPEVWAFDPRWQESSWVRAGEFRPSLEAGKDQAVYHHTMCLGHDGKWHLFGSLATEKSLYTPLDHKQIVHAVADRLDQPTWKNLGVVMKADSQSKEKFLWQPNAVFHDGKYYLFYIGDGTLWTPSDGWYDRWQEQFPRWFPEDQRDKLNPPKNGPYYLYLATSTDGQIWQRHKESPLFSDSPFLFTPYVIRVQDKWVMYYASAMPANELGLHGIFYRVSDDLIHWSGRRPAMLSREYQVWTEHSFIEEPVIFRRGKWWYLLAGPMNNDNQSRYHFQQVFRGEDPFFWDPWRDGEYADDRMRCKGIFMDGHGKILRDKDGRWFISHAGAYAGGVWIAELHWNDSQPDSVDSSLDSSTE